MATIPIIFEDTGIPEADTLGVLTPGRIVKKVDTGKIRDAIADLSGQISAIFQDIKSVGDFKLKEVQLSVEINAEGGVALVGNVKAGAKGAITLTFTA